MTGRNRILVGLVTVTLAAVGAIVWILLGGARVVSAGAVTLEVPSGWSVQNNGDRGLVVAKDESDLLRVAGTGPRLTAKPAVEGLPDLSELVESFDDAQLETVLTGDIGTPRELNVGGFPAVELATGQRREITVALGEGRAWSLVLEGDADELDRILVSVRFRPAAAKRLTMGPLPRTQARARYKHRRPTLRRSNRSGRRATDPADGTPSRSTPSSSGEDGDAGFSADGYANPASAATALAVEQFGMRESEPVLAEYKSETNPDWVLVTFDMGGRQIAVWTREIGPTWQPIAASEGGADAPSGFQVPQDLQLPYFG